MQKSLYKIFLPVTFSSADINTNLQNSIENAKLFRKFLRLYADPYLFRFQTIEDEGKFFLIIFRLKERHKPQVEKILTSELYGEKEYKKYLAYLCITISKIGKVSDKYLKYTFNSLNYWYGPPSGQEYKEVFEKNFFKKFIYTLHTEAKVDLADYIDWQNQTFTIKEIVRAAQ